MSAGAESERGAASVSVRIELFGNARLVAGAGEIAARLPSRADSDDVAAALAAAIPALVGVAVSEDGRAMLPSYVANLNGAAFIDGEPAVLREGDRIYVFSSQAGG